MANWVKSDDKFYNLDEFSKIWMEEYEGNLHIYGALKSDPKSREMLFKNAWSPEVATQFLLNLLDAYDGKKEYECASARIKHSKEALNTLNQN